MYQKMRRAGRTPGAGKTRELKSWSEIAKWGQQRWLSQERPWRVNVAVHLFYPKLPLSQCVTWGENTLPHF